jgi:membrane-associated protease RseP (regulator of RpoE activity)
MKKRIAAAMLSILLTTTLARTVDAAAPSTQPAESARTRVLVLRTDGDPATTRPTITLQNGTNQLTTEKLVIRADGPARTEKAAWLGVATSRAPLSLMKQLKLKSGVVVDDVKPDSPAAAAGLKPQDLIEKLDDQLLINPAQLEALVRMHKAGDSITLTILHEGDRSTVTAKLVEHDVLAMQDDGPLIISTSPIGFAPAPANATPDVQAHTQIMTFGHGDSDPNGHGSSSFQSQFSDGTHQLTISGHDGHKTLVIKDSSGKELFNGPIDTPQQQDAIPQDLMPKFQQMQKMSNMTDKMPTP